MLIVLRLAGPIALTLCISVASAFQAAAADRLEKVVVLSRHGVRPAMSRLEPLEAATVSPWPRFPVPPGHLTPNGAALSRLFGSYYRQLYISENLLAPGDCTAVFYWANVTQRTIATAQALGDGLTPGCPNTVHSH